MRRRDFLRIAGAAGLAASARAYGAQWRPPNIVMILADDLGWADLSCYGSTFHRSPRLDRLAAEGMRFTDAYAAAPVCSATRASILTGRYPASVNLTDFIPGHQRPWAKLLPPEMNQHLPHEAATIPRMLRQGGYIGAHLGKWHLGEQGSLPGDHGFDHVVPSATNRVDKQVTGLTDAAIEFIESYADVPFFLMLCHHTVHIPLEAEPERAARHASSADPGAGQSNPTYAAMIEQLDESVGRLVDRIDALGLAEETLVLFLSDNGGLVRWYIGDGPVVTSNAPLRGEKGTLYEGGVRVPMIARWPGAIRPGAECADPVFTADLMPTFASLAHAGPLTDVDGVSLEPLLRGGATLDREAIYFHYPHYHHDTPCGAVRAAEWKLLEWFEDGRTELYNLHADPGESRDLSRIMPGRTAELRAMLGAWRESVGAAMPRPNPDYDPDRASEWHALPKPWWE